MVVWQRQVCGCSSPSVSSQGPLLSSIAPSLASMEGYSRKAAVLDLQTRQETYWSEFIASHMNMQSNLPNCIKHNIPQEGRPNNSWSTTRRHAGCPPCPSSPSSPTPSHLHPLVSPSPQNLIALLPCPFDFRIRVKPRRKG
jgi:hypothetical protein